LNPEGKAVFIFRVGSLGDSVVALPAIHEISQYYRAELYLISNAPNKEALSSWKVYRHTKYFKKKFEFKYSISSILRLRNFIKQAQGDEKILYYLVDESSLIRNFRNYLFFRIIGVSKIYGWKECVGNYIKKDSNGRLITVIPEYKRLVNIAYNYLGKSNSHPKNVDYITFDSEIINKISLKYGFINNQFIVLGIGGKTDIQKWSAANYIEVLKDFNKEIIVIILGGNGEYNDAKKIQKSLPQIKILNLCAMTSIQESAYILSKAILYFGNDTGTAHLSGIVKTKCVVITSGRNNLERWTPFGEGHTIIRKRTDCEGCFLSSYKDCKFNVECMNEINTKTVSKILFTTLLNEGNTI
jgi:heptosyltransferase III